MAQPPMLERLYAVVMAKSRQSELQALRISGFAQAADVSDWRV
jgi:hypothetical protein